MFIVWCFVCQVCLLFDALYAKWGETHRVPERHGLRQRPQPHGRLPHHCPRAPSIHNKLNKVVNNNLNNVSNILESSIFGESR